MVLTKSQILQGKNAVEAVKIESLGDEVYLRPLTVSEINDLEEIEATAMGTFEATETSSRRQRSQAQTKGKINLAKTTKASAEMKRKAVLLSLNNEKNVDEWTEEDVKGIPGKAFDEIYEAVKKISGIKEANSDEIEDFHQDN